MMDSQLPLQAPRESERRAQLLQHCPLFEGVGSEDLEVLVRSARQRVVKRGAFFFLEGDPANEIYVLAQGKVRLVKSGPQGREIVLGFVESAEPFGFIAPWAGTTRRHSAQATQDSQALAWDARTIARLMTQRPGIALKGLRLMAEQVEGSWERLQDLASGRAEWRIARALLRLAHLTRGTVKAKSPVTLEVRQLDLAELVGTTPYTVSRVLSAWRRMGLVDVGRVRLRVRKLGRLHEIARDAGNPAD